MQEFPFHCIDFCEIRCEIVITATLPAHRRDPWLRGATVADLLVGQATKFQLVVDGGGSPSYRVDDP